MLGTILLGAASLLAATTVSDPTPKPVTHHPSKKYSIHKSAHHSTRKRGQLAIDNERAHQIQEALVHQHYLSGQPSGTWDASTQEAMRRYQADQGWQTKEVPDSRALIRLGLGPDKGHLLNPESAMTTDPQLPRGRASSARSVSTSSSSSLPVTAPTVTPASTTPDLSPSR